MLFYPSRITYAAFTGLTKVCFIPARRRGGCRGVRRQLVNAEAAGATSILGAITVKAVNGQTVT